MRLPITILVLILCFSSCKEKAEKKSEPKTEETESQVQPTEKVDLTKVPDSLELIADKNLIGDFNGDNKADFASLIKKKNNGKI
ncbi:MAG: hypothetical protein KDC67_10495, partial [Ignavibacteriae bacterium]|nr:hypothetical protein [Ignavibacteriota bacterium]